MARLSDFYSRRRLAVEPTSPPRMKSRPDHLERRSLTRPAEDLLALGPESGADVGPDHCDVGDLAPGPGPEVGMARAVLPVKPVGPRSARSPGASEPRRRGGQTGR
jgi:hypothetical protein